MLYVIRWLLNFLFKVKPLLGLVF